MYVKKITLTLALTFFLRIFCAGSGKQRGEKNDSTIQNRSVEWCPGEEEMFFLCVFSFSVLARLILDGHLAFCLYTSGLA